jgi:rod shape-determining protein MreD
MALAMQTTMDRFLAGRTIAVDLVLVSIVYVALTRGPAGGLLTGCVAGLIQDALTSGVIGVGGIAKTIVGFLAGALGQQFIITAAVPRILMFAAATGLHAAIFMGLYQAIGRGSFQASVASIGVQALANAVVGILAFIVIEGLPVAAERRRLARRPRL